MRPQKSSNQQSKNESSASYDYSKFIAPERKATVKENWFIGFARSAGKSFKAKNEFKEEKYKMALDFLGWNLEPKDVNAAPTMGLAISLFFVLPIMAVVGMSAFTGDPIIFTDIEVSQMIGIYAILGLFLIPFTLTYYLQNYVLSAANAERMKSLTAVSEIVSYMVMSMKLSPNLEKALQFAAEHGREKIAEDLKKLVWRSKIGEYESIEEALDEFAYKWGSYSDEFKHALMLIRSSVIEVDEAKRNAMLDKAVSETLEGMKEKMSKYATQMRQPSIYLYYLGVLLPLMLIIMLPIGAVMAKMPIAQTWIIVLFYNILIPVGSILFANNILSKRPPIYIPPVIPDTQPGLPRKGHMRIGKTEFPVFLFSLIAGLLVFLLCYFLVDPMLNPVPVDYASDAAKASYYPFFAIVGVAMGAAIFACSYLYFTTMYKRKEQLRIMGIEDEFQDSIYIIASRLGENRPMEEAIAYTGKFLPKSETAEFFKRTNDNITNLGMTVESALFDPIYGSMKNIPSPMIKSSMQIVIDSMSLGVQHSARALIALSLQLRDSKKVKEEIMTMLSEITSMMKSIAFLIAPLVLGITMALNKIVLDALRAVSAQSGLSAFSPSGSSGMDITSDLPLASFGDASLLADMPTGMQFLLIIALYVIQITVILVYFTSKIEEGDNDVAMKMNIASSVPISLIIFFVVAWFASSFTMGLS